MAGKDTVKMYHYTSDEGSRGIERTQQISQSKGPGDARYGPGVYLTSIPPDESSKLSLMLNNYDGSTKSMMRNVISDRTDKIEKVVEVELPRDQVKPVPSERNVYKVKGDIDLRQHNYVIRDGPKTSF